LPSGFSFDVTGRSPAIHVFYTPNTLSGFDLHNATGMSEVTGNLSKATLSGSTATVDLGKLGTIPTTSTIYLRAHVKWTGGGAAPASSTFNDSISATSLNGDASLATTTNSSFNLIGP